MRLALPAVLLLALALRLWGITFGLPHSRTRPDEEFLIGMALGFFTGDYNPHFFQWPSFSFYVVHAAAWLAYQYGALFGWYADVHEFVRSVQNDATRFFLLVRLMSAACGVATIAVVHAIGVSLFDRRIALVASLFLAVAFLHVRDSHFGVLDVPVTLLIVSAVAVLVRAWRSERAAGAFALAGACAGLATSTKYNAAAVCVVAMVVAGIRFREGRQTPAGQSAICLLLFGTAFAVFFFAGSPYAALDWPAFVRGLVDQREHFSEGHGVRIANAWVHHLTFSLRYGLGLPLLAAALAGIAISFGRSWRAAAVAFAFPLAYFAVLGAGHTAFVRYATPLVPFLCLAAAVTVVHVCGVLLRDGGRRREQVAIAVVAVALIVPSALATVRFNTVSSRTDTRLLAAAWLKPRLGDRATLYESASAWGRVHHAWGALWGNYQVVEFDDLTGKFAPEGEAPPDWIVIAEPPPALYARVPPQMRAILRDRYDLAQSFTGVRGVERESWYDRQDAFYMPYANLSARERPGPTLRIYRRR